MNEQELKLALDACSSEKSVKPIDEFKKHILKDEILKDISLKGNHYDLRFLYNDDPHKMIFNIRSLMKHYRWDVDNTVKFFDNFLKNGFQDCFGIATADDRGTHWDRRLREQYNMNFKKHSFSNKTDLGDDMPLDCVLNYDVFKNVQELDCYVRKQKITIDEIVAVYHTIVYKVIQNYRATGQWYQPLSRSYFLGTEIDKVTKKTVAKIDKTTGKEIVTQKTRIEKKTGRKMHKDKFGRIIMILFENKLIRRKQEGAFGKGEKAKVPVFSLGDNCSYLKILNGSQNVIFEKNLKDVR